MIIHLASLTLCSNLCGALFCSCLFVLGSCEAAQAVLELTTLLPPHTLQRWDQMPATTPSCMVPNVVSSPEQHSVGKWTVAPANTWYTCGAAG